MNDNETSIVEHYIRQYNRVEEVVQSWADLAEYWRKKYMIVCQENNALRRKVSKQYRKETAVNEGER